jgi:xylan 1,4-beta-xylosidase
MRLLFSFLLLQTFTHAQVITIDVNAAKTQGAYRPVYRYFGNDEPNFTYMSNGRKLLGELAHLSPEPVYVRTHFLLATGDGTPSLKWGSTNVYTETPDGKPVYDWTIIDKIFDTYRESGVRPFVEMGFMPQSLSVKPEPYQPLTWIPGAKNEGYSSGWSYPPKDFAKWGELIYQWVRHSVERYGSAPVSTWYWEVWNEPDISYWHGTSEEYDRLYDTAAAAVKRALPQARVGGPATTGPANAKAAAYLRQFLEHVDSARIPLDFITFHAKGRPTVVDGHVRMGLNKNLQDADAGFAIVASFPHFRNLPIVISESDPEGCAACSARVYPQNLYRNGPLYASYTATSFDAMMKLAARRGVNLDGLLTWAFEFENQPYFEGFRTLATNGIDKPVLNYFRMAGLLSGERLEAVSSRDSDLDTLLKSGTPREAVIDAAATRSGTHLSTLIWNYHDDDVDAPASDIELKIAGLPFGVNRVLVEHFRIDSEHSNAFQFWKSIGSPQSPTKEQYASLESAGQLQLLESPQWMNVPKTGILLRFRLPRQAVSLVKLSW